jgi:hypothetical protein
MTGTGLFTIQKWNQLLAGALRAESKSNGRKTVDSVQTKEYIVVLQDHVNKSSLPQARRHRRTFNSSIRTAIGKSSSFAFGASAMAGKSGYSSP